jgi:hypothetical protein
MTTLTVNIDNKKSEKAVKVVLDALGISYNVAPGPVIVPRLLNKAELRIYKRLKRSFEQIKLYQEGKIELKSIEEVLAQLS